MKGHSRNLVRRRLGLGILPLACLFAGCSSSSPDDTGSAPGGTGNASSAAGGSRGGSTHNGQRTSGGQVNVERGGSTGQVAGGQGSSVEAGNGGRGGGAEGTATERGGNVGQGAGTSVGGGSVVTTGGAHPQGGSGPDVQAGAGGATTPDDAGVQGRYRMESLDRGLIAISQGDGKVFLSWRLLGTELSISGFNVYRDGVKITSTPITDSTNYVDGAGSATASYTVRAIADEKEQLDSVAAKPWANQYLEIPLEPPPGGKTPDGKTYDYSANDASVGDLDGDGQYEVIVKWYPSNAQDNAFAGYTGETYLDAYKLDGKRLWRIDLGKNIRSGAHYTQFQVMDYDGDGVAEVACKTADGTIDGTGKVIGDAAADWRKKDGYVATRDRTGSRTLADGTMVADLVGRVLSGPEYMTVFAGKDGRALATVDYKPKLGKSSDWGDDYGNRSERYLAASAYLDGILPSIVMGRGYYGRLAITAYDFRNGKLTERWAFDTANGGDAKARGQGNHNLSVGDVDGDGKDEIVYGAAAFDDDGSMLYATGLGHGDAMHLGDLDPSHPGLEVWDVHESSPDKSKSSELHDARTGEILVAIAGSGDVGRGLAADIDANSLGYEMWSSASGGVIGANGKKIAGPTPSMNSRVYWDGDLQDEILDNTTITKWASSGSKTLLTATGCSSNNGSKNNSMLSVDIFGDWREEVIWRTTDSKRMRIYSTTIVTKERLYTLMHDPVYRVAIAWQNTAYNQPPHLGFFLGAGVAKAPKPNIVLARPR